MLSTKAFVRQTLRLWYPDRKKVVPAPVFRDPVRLNWEHETATWHPEALGEYTLNPATQGVDFSRMPLKRFEILELPDLVGKPLWQVGAHLASTYGNTHLIPGIELWSSLLQNERRATKILQPPRGDWRAYFLFGSLVRVSSGYWYVPCAYWDGGQWDRYGNWLENDWHAECRVVLARLPLAR